jgi:hypothetical protein
MLTTKVFVVEFKPFPLLLDLADHLMGAILRRKWVDSIFKWLNCRRVISAHIGVFYFYLDGKSDSNSNFTQLGQGTLSGRQSRKLRGGPIFFLFSSHKRIGPGGLFKCSEILKASSDKS